MLNSRNEVTVKIARETYERLKRIKKKTGKTIKSQIDFAVKGRNEHLIN